MTYMVTITDSFQSQINPGYQPERFECEEPEEAMQAFVTNADRAEGWFDFGELVERLANGKPLRYEEHESGRTVVAEKLEEAEVS